MIRIERSPTAVLWLVTLLGPVVLSESRFDGPEVAARQAATVVPFRLVADYLVVVDGSIAGLHELKLVIDTGTSRTVIHQGIARTLALPPVRRTVQVFGEHVITESVLAPSLAFGSVHATDLQVLTADLEPQQQRFGLQLDALVAMDVLGDRCFTIDYVATTIRFECINAWPTRASLDPLSPYPVVEVSIDGARYRLLVDSGSEAIVIFENAIPPGTKIKVEAEVVASHLTGTKRLKRFTAGRFSLGEHSIGTPPVFIMSDTGDTREYDGVLGTRWLSGTRVYIDFERRVLSWR